LFGEWLFWGKVIRGKVVWGKVVLGKAIWGNVVRGKDVEPVNPLILSQWETAALICLFSFFNALRPQ
jgi:hypothetical protein